MQTDRPPVTIRLGQVSTDNPGESVALTLEQIDELDILRTGDVVQLKSGGPELTVERIKNDKINCLWFDGSKVASKEFYRSMLAKAPKSWEREAAFNTIELLEANNVR